jgi:hypothetical protein
MDSKLLLTGRTGTRSDILHWIKYRHISDDKLRCDEGFGLGYSNPVTHSVPVPFSRLKFNTEIIEFAC